MRIYKCIDEAMQRSYHRWHVVKVATVATVVQLCDQIESRLCLNITSDQAMTGMYLAPFNNGPTAMVNGVWYFWSNEMSMFIQTIREHGGIVKEAWWSNVVTVNSTPININVLETIGPPMTDDNSYEV